MPVQMPMQIVSEVKELDLGEGRFGNELIGFFQVEQDIYGPLRQRFTLEKEA